MWLANSGTPRFWCICLLLTYHGSPAARRRHLDCNTCSLRIWVRAGDLQAGHAYSIMRGMSCLYGRTPFLTERSLFLFRRGPSIPILWAVFYLTWSMWGNQVSSVSRVTPDNELCRHIGLFPEECYWSGLDETPSGTREDYRGALRDINGDSPFTHPPLKVAEVWLQVADEQRRLAGRGSLRTI
jgi:hypothetical protein